MLTRSGRLFLLMLLFLSFWDTKGFAISSRVDSLRQLSSDVLMERGRQHFVHREPADALACFVLVSERDGTGQNDVRQRIRALNNCACVYKFFYFDYTQAYDYFTQAYDLCQQTGYDEFLPVVMLNLGDLLNDYSLNYNSKPIARQAWNIFDRCIHQAFEQKNWELLTTAFFNLANQNYTLDLSKYRMLFSKEIPASTPDIEYVRLQYQGIAHIQRGEHEQARQCFRRQLQAVSTQWEPERDTLATYMSLAYTYQAEHNFAHSIDNLLRALEHAERNHIEDLTAGICQQLSDSYRKMGNGTLADQYHVRYLEKREAMFVNQLSSIAELNYIRELKQEGEKARQLEEQQRYQQVVMMSGGIVLAVVIVFSLLLLWKNRQLLQRDKSLYEKNRQVMRIEADEQNLRKAYSKSSLNDEQRETLVFRIQEVLGDADVICQQDFTLGKLAKLINSNTTYVSQVINKKYGMTFSNLLGSYRIRVACQWMDNPAEYGHLTIEAIASATGFKSRTSFVNAFKRETGLKPSEYLRMATTKQ